MERAIWQRFKNDDVIVLGLNRGQSRNSVLSLFQQLDVTFPAVLDPAASVYRRYAGGGSPKFGPFPRDVIIDREGKILYYSKAYHPKEMIKVIEDYLSATKVAKREPAEIMDFNLFNNYPNPFNPQTTIEFSLQKKGHVRLNVFNLKGELVAKLIDEPLDAGRHNKIWNAKSHVSGIYLYELAVGDQRIVKKMNFLK